MAKRTGLFVTFFALPFGNAISIPFLGGVVSGNRLAGIALVVCYLLHGLKLHDFDSGRYRVTTPLLLLCAWSVFSLLWCPDSERLDALVYIGKFVQIGVQLYILYDFFQTRNDVRLVAMAYVGGLVVVTGSAALGIASWVVDPAETHGRLTLTIYGGCQNANELGNQAVAGLLVLGFACLSTGKRIRLLACGTAPLLMWIALAAGSRGAIIAGAAAILIVLAVPTAKGGWTPGRGLLLCAIGAAICVPGYRLATHLDERVLRRYRVNQIVKDAREDRMASAIAGLRYVFSDGNLLGAGRAGGCRVQYGSGNRENVVHCMPVQWMADYGVPTIFIYVLLFWRTFRCIRNMPQGILQMFCRALSVFVFLLTIKGGGMGYVPWTWVMLGVTTAIAHGEATRWAKSPGRLIICASQQIRSGFITSKARLGRMRYGQRPGTSQGSIHA